ncbi:heme exporter protein CcmD [Tahibacter soli]|jgi:heme exporter protein D|uniref:Heme exporter protein D n=1 Tax=Tahibacter soli TaxID=2983605 RepID=A0A9X3YGE4_9GAMM|nr:heme exporter protein CcmD [Tahibacter soli]MDC8011706.1 heme exporter protein CcmD [Tahibacter soli]
MNEFFSMGGYGGFVWSAYAIFFVALAIDAFAPLVRKKRVLRELRGRSRRERAKTGDMP